MDDIKVLDCTLRDGGYCNEWKFGNANIKKLSAVLQMPELILLNVVF